MTEIPKNSKKVMSFSLLVVIGLVQKVSYSFNRLKSAIKFTGLDFSLQ
jgi:hypothetical protein